MEALPEFGVPPIASLVSGGLSVPTASNSNVFVDVVEVVVVDVDVVSGTVPAGDEARVDIGTVEAAVGLEVGQGWSC